MTSRKFRATWVLHPHMPHDRRGVPGGGFLGLNPAWAAAGLLCLVNASSETDLLAAARA